MAEGGFVAGGLGYNPGRVHVGLVLVVTGRHEIDEILGFGSALNGRSNGAPAPTGAVWPEDLFRYAAGGARSFNTGLSTNAYFSLDGTTQLAQFNQHAGGDFSDWFSFPSGGHPPQVQDAYATPGATPNLGIEFRALDAIGYRLVLLPGDVNHDGVVNGLDISLIDSNWFAKGSNPADANGDGVVNGLDIALISANWLQSYVSGVGGGAATAVPEPSTFISAVFGVVALLACRWCRAVKSRP